MLLLKILYFPIKYISMRIFSKFCQEQRVPIKNEQSVIKLMWKKKCGEGKKILLEFGQYVGGVE